MNPHDKIELLPLPENSAITIGGIEYYLGAQVRDAQIAAIEPYAKRIAGLEAARIAYASEFAPDEDGNPDVGSIHENIRKLKDTLQSQDAERMNWIEANHGCEIIEFADGTWEVDMSDGTFGIGKGMREAIDHARRGEGEGE